MEHFSNEFCQMELFDQFVVLTVNENVNFTLEKATELRDKLRAHYRSKDFLMISHRKFKHKISKEVYKHGHLPNMKGLAVVSSDNQERDQAIIEQPLYEKSFVFFSCLDEAKSWAEAYF